MSEITSEIIDGVKVWQVPRDKLAEASDIFSEKLKTIYQQTKDAAEAAGKTLDKNDISKLRNHKDLGMWFSGNTPLAVDSVNSFLTQTPIGARRKILKKVSLKIPKDTANTFGRKFFENIDNAPREFTDWLDRLEGVSKKGTFWPEGMDFKGFKKYIAQIGYKNILDLNKALEAKLGFKFDVGHLWGALGGKGERTLVGPLGARSEGKFSPQNVAPQPRSLTLEQLLDPKWNVIEPNVPPFFSKAGYQVAGAQELLDVYGGGQGFSSTLADYLMSNSSNIEKLGDLPPEAVAYVAFADPTKGDFIGKTPEARYAQMFDPDIREDIWRQTAELAANAEDLSGPVKSIFKPDSKTARNLFDLSAFPAIGLSLWDRGLNIGEQLLPSEESIAIKDEHGLMSPEFGRSYAKDVVFNVGAYQTISKLLPKVTQVAAPLLPAGKATALAAGVSSLSVPMLVGGTALFLHTADQRLFKGKVGRILNEMKPSLPFEQEGKEQMRRNIESSDYAQQLESFAMPF